MPTAMAIGRDAELETIQRVLDAATTGVVGLVIDGEAGIGKSALLEAARSLAAERGCQVLVSRAAEAEASWSLLAVADLLEGVAPEVVETLPAPQRRALDVVLRRVEPDGRPVEQATVAAALRGALTVLAADRPVVLVLDDVHWLDEASAAVVGYALRRLTAERVAVVAARRRPEPSRLDLTTLLPPGRTTSVQLGPLSLSALRSVLEARHPGSLTRATLSRIHDAAQGNPLFALEISRVLDETGVPPLGEPLPVPSDVQELIRRRLADLPTPTRRLLLHAALAVGTTGRVLPEQLGASDLAPLDRAVSAGVLSRDGALLRFTHPFHTAAILADAGAAEAREVRLLLADRAASAEERARHLARAADEPDPVVAHAVEAGAEGALARGAPLDAALLYERAYRLTPEPGSRLAVERALRAAGYYIQIGEHATAERLLDELATGEAIDHHAAETLRLRAELRAAEDDLVGAEAVLVEALEHDPDAHRCALDLVACAAQRREFETAQRVSRSLVARLDPDADGPLLAEVLAASVMTDFRAGERIDWARVERALALEDADAVPVGYDPPSAIAAYLAYYARRFDDASARLTALRDDLALRGLEDGYVHTWLGRLEACRGNFVAAVAHYDEGLAITELTGNRGVRDQLAAGRALAEVCLGHLDVAPGGPDPDRPTGGLAVTMFLELHAAVLAALSGADPTTAWELCRRPLEQLESEGMREPALHEWVPDAVELVIAQGETERAAALIDAWEARGHELGYRWVLALGAHCRAVLAAAHGDHAGAIAAAEEALRHHRSCGMPFERARTLLVLGVAQRRVRRRADARRTLGEALAELDRMGCRLWAERARDELSRIGGRAPSEGALSISERRVVELAVDGATNKEIAATLSISVNTVEAHLSHAFVKLGVTRRTQLAGRLAESP